MTAHLQDTYPVPFYFHAVLERAERSSLRAEVDAILDVELVRFADALERLGR